MFRTKEKSIEAFENLEKESKEKGPLKIINELDLEVHNSFEELLLDFISRFNYLRDKSVICTTSETMFDDCNYYRNRSLGDLYRIVLYYYSDISILDIVKFLYNSYKNQIKCIGILYCPDINKIVFYNFEERHSYFNEENLLKMDIYKRKDNILFQDYLNIAS